MKNAEWIDGLPFYTPSNKMENYMTVGDLIENLIYTKKQYDIFYPDDGYINFACNILERMPRNIEIEELITRLEKENEE